MPNNQFTCPECDALLRPAKIIAPGKKIRCPKCQTVFATSEEEDQDELPARKQGDCIRVKKPLAARKRVVDEDEDEEEDRPLPKRKRPLSKQKSSSVGLIVGLIAGGVVLLVVAGGFGAWAMGWFSKGSPKTTPTAEPTYTIKFKEKVDVGKSATVRGSDQGTIAIRVLDSNDKVLSDEKLNLASEEVYTLTVLEADEKGYKKYSKAYEKANESKGGPSLRRSYQGRTVVFERKENTVQITVEGKPDLRPIDVQHLREVEARKSSKDDPLEGIIPTRAVKVGESWTIDGTTIARQWQDKEQPIDAAASSGEGKLVKVYEKNGKQWGTIDITLKLAVKSFGQIPLNPPGIQELKTTLDTAIDGSNSEGSMKITMSMTTKTTVEQLGQKRTAEISYTLNSTVEQSTERDADPGKKNPP